VLLPESVRDGVVSVEVHDTLGQHAVEMSAVEKRLGLPDITYGST
jgi:hypothetical protein